MEDEAEPESGEISLALTSKDGLNHEIQHITKVSIEP